MDEPKKKRPVGNPPHEPTPKDRAYVESLTGYGIDQAQIASMLKIDLKTLRKHYRDELDNGTAKANAAVAQSLYKKAVGDGNQAVTAAIFWMKTRARWKTTDTLEHTGRNGGPVMVADLSKLKGMTETELDVLERALIQIGLAEGNQAGEGEPED